MFGPSHFRFLNVSGEIRDAADWNDPGRDKLWLYNLHYFDDLCAAVAASRASWHLDLIARWIHENPPPHGNGWEPYPTSLRIVNWVKWAWEVDVRPVGFDRSLVLQTRWLAKHVEYHLLANHLIANAKALVFSGMFFEGAEADRWRAEGLAILDRELREQVLADGGHFERSPMYHAVILEDVLDLINAARTAAGVIGPQVIAGWCDVVARMLGWLSALSHPDGQIAFFNDAAFGIAPTRDELTAYSSRLGLRVPATAAPLSDSGYRRVERAGAVLIADLAPVGANYQPGHAHADTLSFEFSLDGQRVFVNSGTSTYQPGLQRQFERSTAAHNTIEIDAEDSSEVWSTFRVARRAWPGAVAAGTAGDGAWIRGWHDGYTRLAGKPIHSREWRLEEGRLRITDAIAGHFERAVARFYLHPLIDLQYDQWLQLPNGRTCRWSVVGGVPCLIGAQWYPEFGRSEANRCLEVVLDGDQLIFELVW
jgi:uncharacterized heparinase superfamily protein